MVISPASLRHDEQATLDKLMKLHAAKQERNQVRRSYHDAKNVLQSLGIAIPVELETLNVVLGWPRIAVEAIASRCVLTGFTTPDGGDLGMDQIIDDNDLIVGAEVAHNTAGRYGAHLAFVTAHAPGEVNISLRPATHATALWDASRKRISAALSIIATDIIGRVTAANMYLPGRIVTLERTASGWRAQRVATRYPGVPVVALRHAPDDDHPLGTSRITRDVMALTDSAMRTWARSEVAAEFFSAPQRYLINASKEVFADDKTGEQRSQWESIIGRIWAIPPNEDLPEGAKVEVGEFKAASQDPHMAQLRQIAANFAAATKIPAEMLGVKQEANPQSEGALAILERPLVTEAQRAIRVFGVGWRQVAQLALMTRDGLEEPSPEARTLRPTWLDPALPSKQQAAAAVVAQVNAGILPADCDVTLEQLGYDKPTIERLRQHRAQAGPDALSQLAAAMNRQNPVA